MPPVWASYLHSRLVRLGADPGARGPRRGSSTASASIDNSEGGNTQRANVNVDLRWQLSENDTVKVHGYGQYYQLDLFSNFTFFLNDPVNGDQIEQSDRNRIVAGLDTAYEHRGTPRSALPSSARRAFSSASTGPASSSPTPSTGISSSAPRT